VRIRIDPEGRTPASVQLREAIAARIASGRLGPGDRIPPVRELADRLGLAPNTVAKAYRALEASGYLEGRGRHGTFVAAAPPGPSADGEAALEAAARTFAARAQQLGVPKDRALAVVRAAIRAPSRG
jgi:DNA-binding transcriptional regulator YhcF (GntR family)